MKKFLICSLLVLLTICLFVGCSSSPKETEKEVTFKFVNYPSTIIGTYTKTFTEDKWGDVLKEEGTITIDNTEYSIFFDTTSNAWIICNDTPCILYNSEMSTGSELKSEDAIIDEMIIYCVYAG